MGREKIFCGIIIISRMGCGQGDNDRWREKEREAIGR
jgi:hypothetical protein